MLKRLFPIFLILTAFLASPALAASAIIHDGDTIQLGDVTYRLDGIDAPELDQICIDDHADPWSCGVDARDQLTKLINGRWCPLRRPRRRQDVEEAPRRRLRRRRRNHEPEPATGQAGAGDQRRALALKAHTKNDAASARADKAGLWKGCLVAPQEFRIGKKDGTLIGGSCRADRDKEIRAALFPQDLAQPPSCPIKGKLAARARFTGNVGVYHLQGCRSYAGLGNPDRWFCSEDDAQAAGFRRAFNCRASLPGK